ncbi:cation:dicarboxylase symporter family transporter, partial [Staphylococcus warneri]
IVNIIPTNIVEAFGSGELLPVIFFSVFFGLALAAIGQKAQPVKDFLGGALEAVFWMIGKVLLLAPVAVFAFITTTIITFG